MPAKWERNKSKVGITAFSVIFSPSICSGSHTSMCGRREKRIKLFGNQSAVLFCWALFIFHFFTIPISTYQLFHLCTINRLVHNVIEVRWLIGMIFTRWPLVSFSARMTRLSKGEETCSKNWKTLFFFIVFFHHIMTLLSYQSIMFVPNFTEIRQLVHSLETYTDGHGNEFLGDSIIISFERKILQKSLHFLPTIHKESVQWPSRSTVRNGAELKPFVNYNELTKPRSRRRQAACADENTNNSS